MPTPSSHAPDPQSPRPFPASLCPEPEDQQTPESASQHPPQPQMAPSPGGPSSWRPHAQRATNLSMDNDVAMSPSSSIASPGSQPESSVDDVNMEQEQRQAQAQAQTQGQADGMAIARDDDDDADDGHKRSDADDEMLTTGDESARGQAVGGAVGGSSSRGAARPAASAEAPGSSRRKPRSPRLLAPVAGAVHEVHEADVWDPVGGGQDPRWVEDSGLVGLGLEYSHMRVVPPPASFYLRPGSLFTGTQQSKRHRYDVEVEIKYVDMRESFLCGYLKIEGLADDHPTLTTYFEGELIGPKYGFITEHASWGATDKIDLSHWSKFTAFRPFAKQLRKGEQAHVGDMAQRENIFMRWKEHFLVPDHRVRMINGASFEGFYYICFNQVRGEVSGIYYHSRSEE
ncbi:hypothetical protein BT67DRAFT_434220 [Trichocladium antarcticum]|uniref:Uncharacterized protein n=1 Tax=Trichocladium antarcticum TaxID=1450529 RepID=A0AAN6UJC9_9PEZI|nr:hypothetical protein BT67DRAFT_434220 [Trichocladium antarcticum]